MRDSRMDTDRFWSSALMFPTDGLTTTIQHFLSHTHTEPPNEQPAEPERQIQQVTVTACMYANANILTCR